MENATRKELEAYIGLNSKSKFFKKALTSHLENPNKPIWCFSSFFFNILWFAYRKAMFPVLILYLTILTLLTLIPLKLSVILFILIFLICGLFGTNLYFAYAEKEISIIKKNYMGQQEIKILEAISKRGNTSYIAAFLTYCALAFMAIMIIMNI